MRFLAVCLVFLSVLPARAQWTRVDTNLPLVGSYAGSVLAVEGGTLVTMALQGTPFRLRAFRSTNDGGSWTEATTFGPYTVPPQFPRFSRRASRRRSAERRRQRRGLHVLGRPR